MNTTDITITPAARFIAADAERSYAYGSSRRRAISDARYWESSPRSYTAAQVTAARRLIWALGQGIATSDDFLDVQELMS